MFYSIFVGTEESIKPRKKRKGACAQEVYMYVEPCVEFFSNTKDKEKNKGICLLGCSRKGREFCQPVARFKL